MFHVDIQEDCDICGSGMTLHTTLKQECPDCNDEGRPTKECCRKSWWAYDGDTVQCSDCGAIAYINADGEDAYVSWPDESEHNDDCEMLYLERKGVL